MNHSQTTQPFELPPPSYDEVINGDKPPSYTSTQLNEESHQISFEAENQTRTQDSSNICDILYNGFVYLCCTAVCKPIACCCSVVEKCYKENCNCDSGYDSGYNQYNTGINTNATGYDLTSDNEFNGESNIIEDNRDDSGDEWGVNYVVGTYRVNEEGFGDDRDISDVSIVFGHNNVTGFPVNGNDMRNDRVREQSSDDRVNIDGGRGGNGSRDRSSNWLSGNDVRNELSSRLRDVSSNRLRGNDVRNDSRDVSSNWLSGNDVRNDSRDVSSNWLSGNDVRNELSSRLRDVSSNRLRGNDVRNELSSRLRDVSSNRLRGNDVRNDSRDVSSNWLSGNDVRNDSRGVSSNWLSGNDVRNDSRGVSSNWLSGNDRGISDVSIVFGHNNVAGFSVNGMRNDRVREQSSDDRMNVDGSRGGNDSRDKSCYWLCDEVRNDSRERDMSSNWLSGNDEMRNYSRERDESSIWLSGIDGVRNDRHESSSCRFDSEVDRRNDEVRYCESGASASGSRDIGGDCGADGGDTGGGNSGDSGGNNGDTGGNSGDTGGNSGDTGGTSGDTGGNSGDTGGYSGGDTGGDCGNGDDC